MIKKVTMTHPAAYKTDDMSKNEFRFAQFTDGNFFNFQKFPER